ncbi:hypothetical protein QQ045_020917 [Rhodiola kirilowii]
MSTTGDYDIRSAYHFAFTKSMISTGTEGECSSNVQIRTFWKTFWKLPLPRKVKIFGWCLYHNALPVGMVLQTAKQGIGCQYLLPFVWLCCRVAKSYFFELLVVKLSVGKF